VARLHNNIILIGMPGSGKSTVGVLLAKALGYGFLDVDLILQQQHGALLQDLLDRCGTEAFLDMEAQAIEGIVCDRCVIAPGGSAVCRPAGVAHLQSLGMLVYLRLPFEALEARINNLETRGIAMGETQTLRALYDQRAPLYARYADLTVDADGLTPAQTVAELVRRLRRQKGV